MIRRRIPLWEKEEYHYEPVGEFIPFLLGFCHEKPEDGKNRPCLVIVPGGGYAGVSPSEAEGVAKAFYDLGYQTFVCVYTTDPLHRFPLKLQPARDLSRALRLLRRLSGELSVDPGKIALCGFSAGAHLAGTLAVHSGELKDTEPYGLFSNRPDAAVLCYPVVTAGDRAHRGSFETLLGKDASPRELAWFSLEKHVTEAMPPCFIWHTATDASVPVENSLLLAEACRKKGVTSACHIFSSGRHGLSLADEDWENNRFGERVSLEQAQEIRKVAQNGTLRLTAEEKELLENVCQMGLDDKTGEADEEVAAWKDMADCFLRKVFDR